MKMIELLKKYTQIDREIIEQLINQGYEIKTINQCLNYLEDSFEFCFVDDVYLNVSLNFLEKGVYTKNKHHQYIDHKPVSIKNSKHKLINGDLIVYKEIKGIIHIIKVLKHSIDIMVGYVFFKRKQAYFNPLMPNLKQVYPIKSQNAFKNRAVYRAVFCNDKSGVKLLEEIKDIAKLKIKVDAYLKLKKVRNNFNNKIKKELASFNLVIDPKNYPSYQDLRNEYFFTIDGVEAKDFDDAVSIIKINDFYRLKVAIADVSAYVKKDSAIDKEASLRSTSIYFLNRVIPMLPFELADDLCSLKPNLNRLALVLSMDIKDGRVLDYKFDKAIINSKHRLTYDYVNELLKKAPTNILEHNLHLMNHLAKEIRAIRINDGAISFKEDELNFKLKNDKVVSISKRQRFDAELMIEDFMLCANQTVANHLKSLELPMVYRNHSYPKLENLEEYLSIIKTLGYDIKLKSYQMTALELRKSLEFFQNHSAYDILSDLLLRSMAKASYQTYSEGHFALTFENYCHFTSPIRRYPDLLVHRIIHQYILDCNYSTLDNDAISLSKLVIKANEQEKLATEIERQISDMAIADYLKKDIGQVFEAKIVAISDFGFFVSLDMGARGLVHKNSINKPIIYDDLKNQISINNQIFKVGSKVLVKLIFIDEYLGKLDFKLVLKRGVNEKY